VIDLGHFRACKVVKDSLKLASDRIKLMKSYVAIDLHAKASDKFKDAAGRFYLGGGKGGTAAGFGEPHKAKWEADKEADSAVSKKRLMYLSGMKIATNGI